MKNDGITSNKIATLHDCTAERHACRPVGEMVSCENFYQDGDLVADVTATYERITTAKIF